jgi:hypothetical protein
MILQLLFSTLPISQILRTAPCAPTKLGGSRNTDAWTDDLDGNNLSADNFFQVRHIFRLDSSYPGHVALIIISPLAKTVDYLNSSTARDGDKMGVVFNLLLSHLGEASLPYEWRVRQGHEPVQGKASADCEIYAMTNAMFIAFGYEVDYGDKDMRVRRHVIANDLHNGPATVFYQPAAGVPIPDVMQQYFYPLSEY